ncbi:MAG: hypothetical protein IPL61_07545 [Myxococcales bacterium]|nr:hypothetical protein [Myxococcales bacterium]
MTTTATTATTTPAPAPAPTAPPPRPNQPSARVLELERMSLAALEQVFVRGVTPDLAGLAGWEFRGLNSPAHFKLLGIKKFVKGFWRDAAGATWGYNYPVEQNRIADGWYGLPSVTAPKRFGFYTVAPVDPTARDNRYLHALLLDYGRGGNPRFDASAGLRDYVVQVDAADPDLLLGKAYYALGPLRVPTASFFILERHQPGPTTIAR